MPYNISHLRHNNKILLFQCNFQAFCIPWLYMSVCEEDETCHNNYEACVYEWALSFVTFISANLCSRKNLPSFSLMIFHCLITVTELLIHHSFLHHQSYLILYCPLSSFFETMHLLCLTIICYNHLESQHLSFSFISNELCPSPDSVLISHTVPSRISYASLL